MPRKQKEGETHEQFHSILSGLGARCNLMSRLDAGTITIKSGLWLIIFRVLSA